MLFKFLCVVVITMMVLLFVGMFLDELQFNLIDKGRRKLRESEKRIDELEKLIKGYQNNNDALLKSNRQILKDYFDVRNKYEELSSREKEREKESVN